MPRQTAVAVIGAGVAGLTAAYLLQKHFDVTLFEARDRLGGNAHTYLADTGAEGEIPVDLAFVTYSETTYPYLVRLFNELGVSGLQVDRSMAMDVVCGDCGFTQLGGTPLGEGATLTSATADSPDRERFTVDLARFQQSLVRMFMEGGGTTKTLGELIEEDGYSDYFTRHFLYPRTAPWFLIRADELAQMPLQYIMNVLGRYDVLSPEVFASWRVIEGGSREYIGKIAQRLTAVRTSTPVTAVRRVGEAIEVQDAAGRTHQFDKAVIATPAHRALALLTEPTPLEERVLSAFRYSTMDVALHSDSGVAYRHDGKHNIITLGVSCGAPLTSFTEVHVDARALHRLDVAVPYFITYAPSEGIDAGKVAFRASYEHPIIDTAAYEAQQHLPEISGSTLAFAGAYHGGGYHEDGCRSGAEAAAKLGAPWD
ncbi:NAD(P)/FAD-dependent oxidoreductase [Nonomuraea sp. NPDC050783]|uniref:NAD(P)/FAD-dependent oxidoreductase n=1 Tax=Nonomuraea sp. NPDC050783 TaxID=3154634 RepID=UPI003466B586